MQLFYGEPEDIENWMELVSQMSWNFPGLETQEKLDEHKATVLKFMGKRQAVCVKDEAKIVGVMLFSRNRNMIFLIPCIRIIGKKRKLTVSSDWTAICWPVLKSVPRNGQTGLW